jgi:hypothetical protein
VVRSTSSKPSKNGVRRQSFQICSCAQPLLAATATGERRIASCRTASQKGCPAVLAMAALCSCPHAPGSSQLSTRSLPCSDCSMFV